uniref:Uncharacterized protein n=1 Tax=Romanomermis culicivorax TaxID=13658 RepID=A0A915K7K1_ROMCU
MKKVLLHTRSLVWNRPMGNSLIWEFAQLGIAHLETAHMGISLLRGCSVDQTFFPFHLFELEVCHVVFKFRAYQNGACVTPFVTYKADGETLSAFQWQACVGASFITIYARSIKANLCSKDKQGILMQQSASKKLHPVKKCCALMVVWVLVRGCNNLGGGRDPGGVKDPDSSKDHGSRRHPGGVRDPSGSKHRGGELLYSLASPNHQNGDENQQTGENLTENGRRRFGRRRKGSNANSCINAMWSYESNHLKTRHS